jgi:hypothetical protein
LVNKRSEVYREKGRSMHRPTKLQTNPQPGIPVLRTELMTANNAALHIPLKAPAAMLRNTIFRECRRKKAMSFIDFSQFKLVYESVVGGLNSRY